MIIKSVKNLRWVRADKTAFDAEIDTDEFGIIPYTSTPDSPTDYGQEIWSKSIAGDYGAIQDYVAPILLPSDFSLSPERFYTLLDSQGKLDAFMAAIETVMPTSMKLTCRNQFNNSTVFSWNMTLMTSISPIVWGADWRDLISAAWIASAQV